MPKISMHCMYFCQSRKIDLWSYFIGWGNKWRYHRQINLHIFFSFYKNLCSLLLHISTRLGNEVIFSLVFNKSLSIYTDTEKLYKQWFQLTHKLVLHVFVKQALQNHKYTTSWLLLLHWKYANQYVLFFSLSLDLNF